MTRAQPSPGGAGGEPRGTAAVPAGLLVLVAYLLVAIVLYGAAWTGDPTADLQGQGGDTAIFVWSIRWVAGALVHGLNPFHSTFLNYPSGVNLLDNTTVVLLGVLATPLTLAFGAVLSFNVLQTLALALSAMSAYLLLRRFTTWIPAAFAGGLLYGFSPYMISAGWGHLHLTFGALIPLLVLCLDELVVRQRRSPVGLGIIAGALAAAQLLVSSEMLADTVELSLIGVVVLALQHRDVVRAKLRFAAVGLGSALASATVLCAYPVWFAVAGPGHGRIETSIPLATVYSSDLLEPIFPTSNQLLSTHALARTGDRLSAGLVQFGAGAGAHEVTNAVYLGLPLLLIVLVVAVRLRREPVVRLFVPLSAIAFLAALGPVLKVNGRATGVYLPERLLHDLPILEATVPLRYGLFVMLGAAVLLAVGLDRLHRVARMASRRPPGLTRVAAGLMMLCALLPLVPRRPYTMVRPHVPEFFSSAEARTIPAGSVVLTYPPPGPTTSITMEWQASTGIRYRMVGAYMFSRYDHDPFSLVPNLSVTELALDQLAAGRSLPPLTPALRRTILAELAAWRIGTVVVVADWPGALAARALFTELLGRRPSYRRGVLLWHRVAP